MNRVLAIKVISFTLQKEVISQVSPFKNVAGTTIGGIISGTPPTGISVSLRLDGG